MQRRRRQSGELHVFGATRYFEDSLAGLATGAAIFREPDDQMIQVKMADEKEQMQERFSYHTQELGAKTTSNLTAFFGSPVSPEASFHKNPTSRAASHDEPRKVSSSSSRGSSDIVTAAAGNNGGHDLGVVMGDRRLQGVRIVRGTGGDEERWVVRCGAWEEEGHVHEKKMFGAESNVDHQVEGEEDGGDDRRWESDSSSDLFELDLERY